MTQTIGVVIPCYKPHIGLLKRLLDSIEAQTKKPDMVIISCSSSEESDIPYSVKDFSFPLQIYTHKDKRNTAQNKNFGASLIETDIISFFDADDIMHPQRIEIIHSCFVKNLDLKLLLHSFKLNPENSDFIMYDTNSIVCEIDPFFVCQWGAVNLKYGNERSRHNGHSSISKELFMTNKFIESEYGLGREDTLFNTEIINKFPSDNFMGYINCDLSWYFPSNTGGYM